MSRSSIVRYSSKYSVPQRFGIPTPIISYICEDTRPTPKVLLKLYSMCKYFWPKLKVYPLEVAFFKGPIVNTSFGGEKDSDLATKDLFSSGVQFYVFVLLGIEGRKDEPRFLASLMSIWRIEATYCFIDNQILTLEEYKLLTENVKGVHHQRTKILYLDSSVVPMNELIMIGSKLNNFHL